MRKAVILFVVLMLLFKVGFSDGEYYANKSVVYKVYYWARGNNEARYTFYLKVNSSSYRFKYFSNTLTSNKTLFKIYYYPRINIVNVSNTSQVLDTLLSRNSSIKYFLNLSDYLIYADPSAPTGMEYHSYTNNQKMLVDSRIYLNNETVCSEGKCNYFYVNFTYPEEETITKIGYYYKHFYADTSYPPPEAERGSYYYSGTYNVKGGINKKALSLELIEYIETNNGLTFNLSYPKFQYDILSPYNLNTLVYVKNDNHYEYAIYVKYNGTIYLLTANNGNYDGFYTDSGLVHYVQCGNTTSNEIDLTATKHPILVQASGGNNFIDVDSICSADSGVNLPDIETINETITNYMSKDYCGMYKIAYDENYLNISGILNDSYYTNGSYATIMLNIIYWNGTTSTISTWGDYNYTFNKSKLFSLKMYCVYNTTPFHIWKYNISYFQGEHKYDLLYEYTNKTIIKDNNSYFWVIYFLGIIPAIFLVGRNHLKIIVGFAFIILFLHIWGIMPGNLIMLLVVLVLTIAMVNRWII